MRSGRLHVIHQGILVAIVICLHTLVLWLLSSSDELIHARDTTMWIRMVTSLPSVKSTQNLPTQQALNTNRHRVPSVSQQQKVSKSNTPGNVPDSTAESLTTHQSVPTSSLLANIAETPLRTPAATSQGLNVKALAEPELPVTQLPSSTADYLNNPPPAYPSISLRLGEQGKVVIRVLIGQDGWAQQGTIAQSSRFDRLDQAALHAVMSWRYVPGTRAGIAQDMWFNVPVSFSLN